MVLVCKHVCIRGEVGSTRRLRTYTAIKKLLAGERFNLCHFNVFILYSCYKFTSDVVRSTLILKPGLDWFGNTENIESRPSKDVHAIFPLSRTHTPRAYSISCMWMFNSDWRKGAGKSSIILWGEYAPGLSPSIPLSRRVGGYSIHIEVWFGTQDPAQVYAGGMRAALF